MTSGTQMRREIEEQPGAVEATIASAAAAADRLAEVATGRRQVLFVARGTSDNAAVYGRYLMETRGGLPAALAAPSVATHYHSRLDLGDTLAVSLSQSGRTEEIVETQRWAAAQGARTVAITNDAASPLATEADVALTTQAGEEYAVPATKSYTGQLAAVASLVATVGQDDELADALSLVPAEIARLLSDEAGVVDAVASLAEAEHIVVTGRGIAYGTALEVGLKLEETCLRPVRGLSYADLRHGPIAVIGPGVDAVLVAAQDGPMLAPMIELAGDLAERGATTLALGGDQALADACDLHVPGPDLPEAVAPLALIVPAQLTVEALSRRLGLDPDQPRGLSKVTATDR